MKNINKKKINKKKFKIGVMCEKKARKPYKIKVIFFNTLFLKNNFFSLWKKKLKIVSFFKKKLMKKIYLYY